MHISQHSTCFFYVYGFTGKNLNRLIFFCQSHSPQATAIFYLGTPEHRDTRSTRPGARAPARSRLQRTSSALSARLLKESDGWTVLLWKNPNGQLSIQGFLVTVRSRFSGSAGERPCSYGRPKSSSQEPLVHCCWLLGTATAQDPEWHAGHVVDNQ